MEETWPPLAEEQRKKLAHYQPGPVFGLLGIRVVGLEAGRAWLEMDARPELTHSGGVVQGGIVTALADASIAFAVRTLLEGEGTNQASIELKINFIRPVSEGLIRAEGRVIHLGRRTAVGESLLTNGRGKTVAKCSSSVMILPGDDPGYNGGG